MYLSVQYLSSLFWVPNVAIMFFNISLSLNLMIILQKLSSAARTKFEASVGFNSCLSCTFMRIVLWNYSFVKDALVLLGSSTFFNCVLIAAWSCGSLKILDSFHECASWVRTFSTKLSQFLHSILTISILLFSLLFWLNFGQFRTFRTEPRLRGNHR